MNNKCLRCNVCGKAIRSLKSGKVQWLHNPSSNLPHSCMITHIGECEYSERDQLSDGSFIEEILLTDIDCQVLENRWDLNSVTFHNVFETLIERFV